MFSMTNINELLGGRIINTRLLIPEQISQLMNLGSKKYPAISVDQKIQTCNRCQSVVKPMKGKLIYCRNCINFGRLSSEDEIIITSSQINFGKQEHPMSWQGNLTSLQQKVSDELIESVEKMDDHLIWAVTGAGKTEMIFPMIEKAIISGKRIAIVSPRIDVCIELFPRIQTAFQATSIGLFHGRSDNKYFASQLVIATVHQMIKFENAFDVIVVDEVDSFPLAGDEMLSKAIFKAKKSKGSIIYLSATPPTELLKQVKDGTMKMSKLYRRFHNHPLPEPKCHLLFKKSDFLGINPRLKLHLKKLIKAKTRFMLFFPQIPELLKFEKEIQRQLPDLKVISVSAKDPERIEKVQLFREQQVHAILTTTILERGVTFHKIAVIVVNADAVEFSKTALIQIAGRAGRAKDSPDDEVHFYYQYFTEQVRQACADIKSINRQAYSK